MTPNRPPPGTPRFPGPRRQNSATAACSPASRPAVPPVSAPSTLTRCTGAAILGSKSSNRCSGRWGIATSPPLQLPAAARSNPAGPALPPTGRWPRSAPGPRPRCRPGCLTGLRKPWRCFGSAPAPHTGARVGKGRCPHPQGGIPTPAALGRPPAAGRRSVPTQQRRCFARLQSGTTPPPGTPSGSLRPSLQTPNCLGPTLGAAWW